jgi:maltose O-acetyltransferase
MKLRSTLVSLARSAFSRLHAEKHRQQINAFVARGLRLGKNVHINHGVQFDHTYPYLIEIGDECRVAEGARFLAHDATGFFDTGVTRIAPIKVLAGSFIGERAIILPGVTIGPRALVAAGAVVNTNIGADMIAAGNPARPCGRFPDLLDRQRRAVTRTNCIDIRDIESGKVTTDDIRRLLEKEATAYVGGWPTGGGTTRYLNADMEYIRQMVERSLESLWKTKEEENPD